MQIVIFSSSGMDIGTCGVTAAAGITIDPFEPMLSTVTINVSNSLSFSFGVTHTQWSDPEDRP